MEYELTTVRSVPGRAVISVSVPATLWLLVVISTAPIKLQRLILKKQIEDHSL